MATLARERQQEEEQQDREDRDLLVHEGDMADVANNQANMFHRNLANMAGQELLENLQDDLSQDEDHNEPSNFQAWYVRSANNSRSRERSAARLEQEQESEPDQDMEETLEGEGGGELGDLLGEGLEAAGGAVGGYERFERHLFRSLSLEQEGASLPAPGPQPSLPSNHNPFLGEPGGNGNLGAAAGGAVPRRNGGYVRNVNQGPGTLYNWQATKTTVKERFAFMFNNEILADVHFKVGRGGAEQRIPAHKFVLSVGSAVFDAMFNSTLATREDEITLPDVEPAAFLALLKFLYSDEVTINTNML